jgi:hypothetical protein
MMFVATLIDTVRADRHERQRERIIAAENREAVMPERRAQLADAIALPPASLMPMMVGHVVRETVHRVDGDLDATTARDAVENERQIRRAAMALKC